MAMNIEKEKHAVVHRVKYYFWCGMEAFMLKIVMEMFDICHCCRTCFCLSYT